MNAKRIFVRCGAALVLLSTVQLVSPWPLVPGLETEAQAVVGLPATPVSVAGVARRTSRRTAVAVSSSASASAAASQQQAAASQQQAAAAQQQAAAAQAEAAQAQQQAAAAEAEAAKAKEQAAQAQQAAKLPLGTIVSALPSGCATLNLGGVDYFNCAGTYFRAAFQSGNVVYVVSQP